MATLIIVCKYFILYYSHDHLYRFLYVDRFGVTRDINHECLDVAPYADEFKIQDLDILQGDTVKFSCYFCVFCKFNLHLEKIDAELNKEPTLLEMIGEAPEQYQYYEEV